MKDYTEEVVIEDNSFKLILDEYMTTEFCSVNQYANIVEIRVHPIIIKLFDTDDVIKFGAWKFLVTCGTPDDDLERFIRNNFSSCTFVSMISIAYSFKNIMFLVMENVDKIFINTDIIRENKYALAEYSHRMDALKAIATSSAFDKVDNSIDLQPTSKFIPREAKISLNTD